MSVMLFLGAGASRAFDYPTTVEFLKIAKENIHNTRTFDYVVQFLEGRDGPNNIDIEKVLWELTDFYNCFTTIEEQGGFKKWMFFDNNLLGDSGTHRQFVNEIKKLRDKIYELVYHTYWKRDFKKSNQTYRKLFNSIKGPVDIFTTNYDLCVEYAFWSDTQLKDLFYDGFDYDKVDVCWKPQGYETPQYRLYKLHGSLNWKYGEDGKILRFNRRDIWDPQAQVMLYPGFKGEPKEQHYQFLHEQLTNKLNKSTHCIAIGFSFRDDAINKIFKNAFSVNKGLRILIWNPGVVETEFPKQRVIQFQKPFGEDTIEEGLSKITTTSQ